MHGKRRHSFSDEEINQIRGMYKLSAMKFQNHMVSHMRSKQLAFRRELSNADSTLLGDLRIIRSTGKLGKHLIEGVEDLIKKKSSGENAWSNDATIPEGFPGSVDKEEIRRAWRADRISEACATRSRLAALTQGLDWSRVRHRFTKSKGKCRSIRKDIIQSIRSKGKVVEEAPLPRFWSLPSTPRRSEELSSPVLKPTRTKTHENLGGIITQSARNESLPPSIVSPRTLGISFVLPFTLMTGSRKKDSTNYQSVYLNTSKVGGSQSPTHNRSMKRGNTRGMSSSRGSARGLSVSSGDSRSSGTRRSSILNLIKQMTTSKFDQNKFMSNDIDKSWEIAKNFHEQASQDSSLAANDCNGDDDDERGESREGIRIMWRSDGLDELHAKNVSTFRHAPHRVNEILHPELQKFRVDIQRMDVLAKFKTGAELRKKMYPY